MADRLITRTVGRVGALRRLPVARLMAVAELVVLAREHIQKLEPDERRRLVELVRHGRGRPGNLSTKERRELGLLLARVEPRAFVQNAVAKVTGVPVAGKRRGKR
ncbi:MAG TPA: hypothetical protein VGF70_13695 [Solirubrobacteraceae bacterium]|jgi:hypothetical protein